MTATSALLVATHPDCARHVPTFGHPERPERLQAALAGAELPGARRVPVEVGEDRVLAAVARVHLPSLAERLKVACEKAPGLFDSPDNPVSEGTYAAAVAAAGAGLAGVDAVLDAGHHARRERAMGFCFFNNVAVAAEELLARGVAPLAIVDFDVHHGNGTQEHFYDRDEVFYLSVHEYPFFPGSGTAAETGHGPGYGFTRNLPLAAGADDDTYVEALSVGLTDVIKITAPQAWLVSAGFDAHEADPVGSMHLTNQGFARIGEVLHDVTGDAPVCAFLEGGYHPQALRESVHAFLTALVGARRA
jgi:acetoin utilization deacetylase AcuC-like enzyme